jgi:hypothetical protein
MHTFQTMLTFQITSSDRLEVDDSTRAAENNEHFSEEEISVRSADGIDALKLEMRKFGPCKAEAQGRIKTA